MIQSIVIPLANLGGIVAMAMSGSIIALYLMLTLSMISTPTSGGDVQIASPTKERWSPNDRPADRGSGVVDYAGEGGGMNTRPKNEPMPDLSFDISEVCEHYPDGCEFCDYNCSGWCSLYYADVPGVEEEK